MFAKDRTRVARLPTVWGGRRARAAPPPAVALVVEVQPQPSLQVAKLTAQTRGFDEAAPLPRREGEHNNAPAVAGDEVTAERSIDVVAETAARLVLQHRLADQAQMPSHREPDSRQAQLHQLALTCEPPVSL